MRKYCFLLLPIILFQCGNPQEPAAIEEVIEEGEPTAEVQQSPSSQQAFVDLGGEEEETTSLIAQRSAVNQEDAINRLISSGTPLNIEPQAPQYNMIEKQVLERIEPVLSAYKNLSLFTYLDDLLRYDYYKSKGLTVQTLGALQAPPRGIVHQGLDYPLVRQHYWAQGGIEIPNGNENYRSAPGNMPKVEDLQNDPYRALISLYELSLNRSNVYKLHKEQDTRYYLFHEEHPEEQEPRSTYLRPSFWATMVYEKAQGLIESKKQEQEARLNVLYKQLGLNVSDDIISKTLDEILSIQAVAPQTYPVLTDIRMFFGQEYSRKPDASRDIITKSSSVRRHYEAPSNNYNRGANRLPANGVALIQEELLSSPLPQAGKEYMRSKYEVAQKNTLRYQQMKAAMEALQARLGSYQLTADESQYFAAIHSGVQHLINTWQISADQFKELHELPAQEKNFGLIPLIELGESQLEAKLKSTPGVEDKEMTLRKLRGYYYQKVRDAETAFMQ